MNAYVLNKSSAFQIEQLERVIYWTEIEKATIRAIETEQRADAEEHNHFEQNVGT